MTDRVDDATLRAIIEASEAATGGCSAAEYAAYLDKLKPALVAAMARELAEARKEIARLKTPTLQWNPDSPETPIESVESLAEHFADYGHPCGVFEVQNAHELPYTYHFYNVMIDSQELDDDEPVETHEVVCREITKEEYRGGLAAASIGWFAKRAKWATDRALQQKGPSDV